MNRRRSSVTPFRAETGHSPGNTVYLRRQEGYMIRSESGVNAAVYLGLLTVATICRRDLVAHSSEEAAQAGEARAQTAAAPMQTETASKAKAKTSSNNNSNKKDSPT